MKLTSVSKSVLASMLIGSSIGLAPVVASADSTNSQSIVAQTAQGKTDINTNFKISVSDNSDGSKTVTMVIPKDEASNNPGRLNNDASYSVKNTDDADKPEDGSIEIDGGSVKTDKDNAKIKIDLDKSALANDQLMNKDLTITIKDSDGKTVGTISNITVKDLMEIASHQQTDSSSAKDSSNAGTTENGNDTTGKDAANESTSSKSKAKSDSTEKVATSNSKSSSEIKASSQKASSTETSNANKASESDSPSGDNNSSQPQSNSSANNQASSQNDSQASQSQTQNFNSVQELINAIKQNGVDSVKGSTVVVTPSNVSTSDSGTDFDGGNSTRFTSSQKNDSIKAGQQIKVTVQSVNNNGAGNKQNGGYDYLINYSNPQAVQQASESGTEGTPNGDNGGAGGSTGDTGGINGDNSQLPQTSNDNQTVVKSGVGIIGLLSTIAAGLGLKKERN